MTLSDFINLIGGMTDKNMEVQIRIGSMGRDDGKLCNIRARLKNKYYVQEFDGWKVSFFNIVDNKMVIQMALKKERKTHEI